MKFFSVRKGNLYCEEYVTDSLGKRHRISVKCKSDSKKDKSEAEKRLDRKIEKAFVPRERMKSVFDAYLQEMSATKKPQTIKVYEDVTRAFLKIIGDIRIDQLSARLIREKLLASGKSMKTCNFYISRWKVIFRWAYKNDFLPDKSVIDKLSSFQEPAGVPKDISDKFLEREELNALLHSDLLEERDKLLVAFLALSGLRVGEAMALNDMDVTKRYIRVTKTVQLRVHNAVGLPKTSASNRDVYIQPELADLITRIRQYESRQREMMGYAPVPYFFADPAGTMIDYDAFRVRLERASAAIGHRITPHALRHTCASLLFEAGMSYDEVQLRLGHENSAITKQIYVHITQRAKQKTEEKLSSIRLLG